MTASQAHQKSGATGDVLTADFAELARALRPLLMKWFGHDEALSVRIKEAWNELRIDASGFDLYFNGPARGQPGSFCDFASSFRGPRDDARRFYQEMSDALRAAGLRHEITFSYDDEDGEFVEEETVTR